MTELEPVTVVLTSVGTEQQAVEISEELIARRLATCVNIVPCLRSIYRWKGKICEDTEYLLFIKTPKRLFEKASEAIREFQIASRDESFFVECCSMIGVCYTEQGMWNEAAPWYRKALSAPGLSEDSVIALKYDLADVLDSAGDQQGAVDLFEEILSVKPAYRDVSVRLNGLSGQQYAN